MKRGPKHLLVILFVTAGNSPSHAEAFVDQMRARAVPGAVDKLLDVHSSLLKGALMPTADRELSANNHAFVLQNGSRNTAVVVQEGGRNSSTVMQAGRNNSAAVLQSSRTR